MSTPSTCDIIIVTRNDLDGTKRCIESVEASKGAISYRYIFVDNGSTDGTLQYLKRFDGSVLIRNKKDAGFVRAMNQGLEKIRARYAVWLDSSVIVTPGWLDTLVGHLEGNPDAGAVGPMSNSAGVMQCDYSCGVGSDPVHIAEYGRDFHAKYEGLTAKYHRVGGFCMVARSKIVADIGPLDEGFSFGPLYDDDYCRRIREAGGTILVARDVFVYRTDTGDPTHAGDPDLRSPFVDQKNKDYFLRKWVPRGGGQVPSKPPKSPLVSVIMATRDRESIIPLAIRSVLSQTYENFELIIVNDGGRDIKGIIDGFEDPRIRYIRLEEHRGKSYANNYAIDTAAGGELIAYLDDDDRLYPDHLEVTVGELVRFESRMLVYADYVQVNCMVNEDGVQIPIEKKLKKLKNARYDPVDQDNFIPNFAVVHRKELSKVERYDEALDFWEDWDVLRRFSKHAYFVRVPKATGEYWINTQGSTRNSSILMEKNKDFVYKHITTKYCLTKNQVLLDLYNADKLAESSKWTDALRIYRGILETDWGYIPALEGCANCLYNLQEYHECSKILDRMIEHDKSDHARYLLQGNVLMDSGKFENAMVWLELSLIITTDAAALDLLQICYKNTHEENSSEFIRSQMQKMRVEEASISDQQPSRIDLESYKIELDELLKIYRLRPDLRKAFPEVKNGDYTRLLEWAISDDSTDSHKVKLRKYKHYYESLLSSFRLAEESSSLASKLQDREAELGRQVDTLEGDKAELGRQVDTLEGDKAELGRQVDTLEGDKAELGRQVDTLEGDKAELGRQVDTLEGDKAELGRQVDTLEGDKAELGRQVDTLEGDKAELGRQVDTLEGDKAELGRQVDTLEGDKAELGRQVDTLEGDKAELGRQVDTLEGDKAELGTMVKRLQAEVDAKNLRVLSLKEQITYKNSELAELQSKYNSLAYELEQINSSLIFSFLNGFTNSLDRTFKPNTRSGEFLRVMRSSLYITKTHGLKKLIEEFIAKKNKSSLTSVLTFKPVLIPKIEGSNVAEQFREELEYANTNSVLTFPKHDSPIVSIIILNHNKAAYTFNCLASVLHNTKIPYEIILINNGCTENASKLLLKQIKNTKSFDLKSNLGFIAGNNFASCHAVGKYLLFLNNDTLVLKNWLESLLDIFEHYEKVGIVGPKFLYPDGSLQEAGSIIWNDGSARAYGRNDDHLKPEYNFVRDVDYVSGACLLVKKSIFEKLGKFSEKYIPAYYEDVDLCFNAHKNSLRVMYTPFSSIVHYEGISSTRDPQNPSGTKRFEIINRPKFQKTWKEALSTKHIPSDSNVLLARDMRDSVRILVIDGWITEHDKSGGDLRVYNILKLLSQLNSKITLFVSHYGASEYNDGLRRLGIEIIPAQNFDVSVLLEDRKNYYDLIVINTNRMSSVQCKQYLHQSKTTSPQTKILLHIDDLYGFCRLVSQDKNIQVDDDQKALDTLTKFGRDFTNISDHLMVITQREINLLQKIVPSEKLLLLPDIRHLNTRPVKKFNERKYLLFVGGFSHTPNVVSAKKIIDDVFPLILKKMPAIEMYFVGNDPPKELTKMENSNIHFSGFVKDLFPYYDGAVATIAYMMVVGGIKGKILESLNFNVPVITTPLGLAGTELKSKKDVLVASNEEEFADAVFTLLDDENLWLRLSQNGKTYFDRYHSLKVGEKILNGFLQSLSCNSSGSRSSDMGFATLEQPSPPPSLDVATNILSERVRRYSETIKLDDPKLNSRIFCNEYPAEPDEDLREHIQIGSAEILTLPRNPKVSIIIPTLNQTDYLRKNLESIESKTTYKNYEIIIVTNNKDGDSEMRRYLDGIRHKVLIYDGEYSFAKINNHASKSARGEYLVFLNDDMEVASPNWLEAMLKLALNEGTGAVGGKLLSADGTLQEAGCIVWGNGNVWNYGRGDDPDKAEYNFVREVDYCSGACLMVRREIFEENGGFDSGYDVAYWEDNDLCQAIRQKGYSILYQPMACFIHHEGRTQGTDTSQGIKSFQVTNKDRYMKKWEGIIQSRHPDSPKNVFFERNRTAGLNILYIDHFVPEYDRDAGSLTAYYVISILASMNHNVTFWPDNLARTEPYATELQQKGIEVVYGNRDFEEFLKGRKETFHVCFASRPHITARYFDRLKRHAPGCKIVYDTTDLHFVREYRMAVLSQDPSQITAASRNSKGELSLIGKSDMVIVRSLKEARFLLNEDPGLSVAVIPPLQIPQKSPVPFEKRKDFLFVGGFTHPPNVDSLEYLTSRIFPQIRERLPDVRLYVIGSNASKKIRDLCTGTKNVAFLGHLPDIEGHLNRCRIMLVPLTYGAGIKGKITSSFAYGLPVVTTSIGAEGMSDDDKILLVGDDPAEFVDRAISAYTDESLWNTLSKNSLAFANSHYSPELVRDTLTQILTKEASIPSAALETAKVQRDADQHSQK